MPAPTRVRAEMTEKRILMVEDCWFGDFEEVKVLKGCLLEDGVDCDRIDLLGE